ncbi:MAG: LysR substrate-binding domain-containing protein [Bradyrhizobium sp.]|nr:LysR substrate-binding domain-containing protein [Bradyrhizobium sp.]
MPQINFKLLHVFIAVAQNKSFRQASELLNRSQSAVSMQIRQLEDQVGISLFHRTTRRVELTAEGQQLLAHAQRALTEWDNGLRDIRDVVDIQRGTLSLACVPTIAATILPRALQAFQTKYPGININLRELAAEDLLDSVRRKEVDFGIGPNVECPAEFQFTPLFDDPIYALASRAFSFRKRASVDLAELSAFPILVNSRSAALRTMLDRALAARNLVIKIKFEMVHTHTLIAFASAGMGVGILPKVALPSRLKRTMQALPIGNPSLVRTVSIITLKGQSFSPAARALAGAVQKFLKAGD